MYTFAFLLVLTAIPALAAKTQTIHIGAAITAGTTPITPGDYKVTWTGTGDAVQVTLEQNKTKVTLPAKLVETKNIHRGYVSKDVDGKSILKSIDLDNATLQFSTAN
jgi:hypothetical protein